MTMKIERKSMLRVSLATALALMWPAAALAQDGAVTGTVTNEEGLAMSTVTVTATGAPLGAESRTAMTSAQGMYTLAGLPPGTYSLRFVFPGFVDGVSSGVVVQAGERTNVDMQLASQRTIALEELTAVVTGTHFSAPPENLPYAVDVTDRESLQEQGAPQVVDFFKKLGATHGTIGERNGWYNQSGTLVPETATNVQSARPGRLANVDTVERPPSGVHPGQTSRRPVRGHQRLPRHRARPHRSPEGGRLGHLRLRRRGRRGNFVTRRDFQGFELSASHDYFSGAGDTNVGAIWGTNLGDGTNAVLSADWAMRRELQAEERDWVLRPYPGPGGGGWSYYGNPGAFLRPTLTGTESPRRLHQRTDPLPLRRQPGRRPSVRGSGLRGSGRNRCRRHLPVPIRAVGQPDREPVARAGVRRAEQRVEREHLRPRGGSVVGGRHPRLVHDPLLPAHVAIRRPPGGHARESGQAGLLQLECGCGRLCLAGSVPRG